ncbi:MAG: hypothetical protein HY983_01665 [Candidatus Magasanikbacteria bacterium]|nr:hypothetical protein [Candidatus Magasanikbacteria bacterium]
MVSIIYHPFCFMSEGKKAVEFTGETAKPPEFFDEWENFPKENHLLVIEQWLVPFRELLQHLSPTSSLQDIEEARQYIAMVRDYLAEQHLGEEEYREEEYEGDLVEGLRAYLRRAEGYIRTVAKHIR